MGSGGDHFGSFTTSCLDDIPFKIGPKFKQPTKILLPPQLDLSNPSSSRALNAEYSFEVELAVLKWSEERQRQQEEQRNLQEQFEQQKQQQQLQQVLQQQQQLENEARVDNADVQVEPTLEPSPVANTEPLYVNQPSVSYPTPAPRISKPKPSVPARPAYGNMSLPNPLLPNMSDNILTPTPIVQSETNTQPKPPPTNPANSFDVTLFEQEDDPFDNLELQTIDDFEELKNVLEETTKNSPSPRLPSGDEAGDTQSDINMVTTTGDDLMNDQCRTHSVEIDGCSSVTDPIYENSVDDPIYENSVDDPIYENSVDDPIYENSVQAVPSTAEGAGVHSSIDIANLPPVPPRRDLVGRSLPLPPIGAHNTDIGLSAFNPNTQNCVNRSLNSDSTPQVPATNPVIDIFRDCNNMPFPTYIAPPVKTTTDVSKPPRPFKYMRHNLDDSDAAETYEVPDIKSVSIQKATDKKSYSVGFNNRRDSSELHGRRAAVRKPPPIPSPRRPPSPPSRPSSNQVPTTVAQSGSTESLPSWNRHSPLPAVPPVPCYVTPGVASTVTPGTGSEMANHVILNAETTNRSTELDRCSPSDPYSKLSTEAQTTVNNLVAMGFPRPRVSRAVERLGQDEKEVVEYLFLVDQLLEKDYNVEAAEMALLMFHNSANKACAYLDLFTQFQQLGFSGDKIKEALVGTNNDREKSLDILTAT